jgi:regulator of sigma D
MKSKYAEQSELRLDVQLVPRLEAATDQWLAARDKFKMEPSDEYQSDYEVTLNDLGAAWGERYPEATDTPDAFEWYRRGLTAPEEE